MEKDHSPGHRHTELPDYEHDVVYAPPPKAMGARILSPGARKTLLRLLILLLVLATVPPVYRWFKNVRAESLLAKSSKSFALGDTQQGIMFLKQAIALSPGNITIQHSVELHNARVGDPSSREKLLARMREGRSGKEELLGLADLEAHAGHAEIVGEIISRIPKNISSRDGLRIALIEAAMAGSLPKAAEICFSDKWNSLGREDRDLLRTRGALYLLSQSDGDGRHRAVSALMEAIGAKSGASLPAWRIMARIAMAPPVTMDGMVSPEEVDELIRAFPSLGGKEPQDRLLLADLKIKAAPASQPLVVAEMIRECHDAPRAEKLEFARWLNSKGLYQETLAFAGSDLPRSDTDWLLVVLDAEAARGNWQEMAGMMETPAGAGIPDAVKHLYLSRSAMMTGNKSLAEEEWRRVGGTLHLEKPETIAYIAGYEERMGEFSRAARAYRELADRKETRVPGLIGLIRCQPGTAGASALIPLYEELVAAQPENTDALCDLTYLRLLRFRDYPDSPATADELYSAQPNSLPRISAAALGRLRSGDGKGALNLYKDKVIDWNTSPSPWKVVYCAVLKANGEDEAAALQSAGINPETLRPEERDLLSGAAKPH